MKLMKNYPKVLIIGQTFNKNTGPGITISNLFYGWPKRKIAVITKQKRNSSSEICNQYYYLGKEEDIKKKPFYTTCPEKSGPFNPEEIDNITKNIKEKKRENKLWVIIRTLKKFTIHLLGLHHLLIKYRLSDKLINWIKEYDPDIIYTHLHYLEYMRLVVHVHKQLHIPIAVHQVDHWLKGIEPFGILKKYWESKIEKEFENLLNTSSVFMCISEFMREEYKKKYNKDFVTFHNPVNVKKWVGFSKTDWNINRKFKILYTGRIGRANFNAIKEICIAINDLNSNGFSIELYIYSYDKNNKFAKKLKIYKGIIFKDPVAHKKIPNLIAKFDLLVLPLDFNKKGFLYSQYSMPTKTSEYMISGVPILVYAPSETALYKYAYESNWAYCVTKQSIEQITNALKELYDNFELRRKLGIRAKELALIKHNAEKVREDFRRTLLGYNTN